MWEWEVGQSRKGEFQAEKAVERLTVPEQEICMRWYFRQVNLKAICLERQVGQVAKTGARN